VSWGQGNSSRPIAAATSHADRDGCELSADDNEVQETRRYTEMWSRLDAHESLLAVGIVQSALRQALNSGLNQALNYGKDHGG
jgi:hypothetical protein